MGCGATHAGISQPVQLSSLQNPTSQSSQYWREQLIGKGTYGKVYRCLDKNNNEYALKVIELTAKNKSDAIKDIQSLKSEISVLKKLNHPNIIKYYNFQVSADTNSVEIVLQLMTGGSLKQFVEKQGSLTQSLASNFCRQILNGLQYLHHLKIIHRDLKCANIMLNKGKTVKITDFGTSKVINIEANDDIAKLSASLKGTPYYMAPEVLKRAGHSFSADIWSLGCTLIEMLSGKAPWTGISSDFEEIIGYISSGMHPPYPPNISSQCLSFLQGCLDAIPSKRLTTVQLLQHQFIDRQKLKRQKEAPLRLRAVESPIHNHDIYLDTQMDTSTLRPKKISIEKTGNSKGINRSKKPDDQSVQIQASKNLKIKSQQKQVRNQKAHIITQIDSDGDNNPPDFESNSVNVAEHLFYIKRAQRKKKYEASSKFKVSKTTTAVKMSEGNILDMGNTELQHKRISHQISLQIPSLRSKTEVSQQHESFGIIDTAVARAERNRYIEQQKKIRELKDNQKMKWEQELKEGAAMLKKEFSNRYMYANYLQKPSKD